MDRVEFFFDCSSPGTYVAFHRLGLLNDLLGFQMVLRPIFIGGLFKAANPGVFDQRASMPAVKDAYFAKDYADWSRFTGLHVQWPHPAHPVNSVKAMRGVVGAGHHGRMHEVAKATFEAFFRDSLDISRDEVLIQVCERAGFDADTYFRESGTEAVKAELRANTDELVARGGFGSPSTFINGPDMYWGNDKMELIRAALTHAAPGSMGGRPI